MSSEAWSGLSRISFFFRFGFASGLALAVVFGLSGGLSWSDTSAFSLQIVASHLPRDAEFANLGGERRPHDDGGWLGSELAGGVLVGVQGAGSSSRLRVSHVGA